MTLLLRIVLYAVSVLKDKELRNKRLIIRVTKEEWETIRFCCSNSLMSISDVGRKLFFDFCCQHNLKNFNRLV